MLENGDAIEESEFHLLRRAPGLTMEDLSLKQYWSTLRVGETDDASSTYQQAMNSDDDRE